MFRPGMVLKKVNRAAPPRDQGPGKLSGTPDNDSVGKITVLVCEMFLGRQMMLLRAQTVRAGTAVTELEFDDVLNVIRTTPVRRFHPTFSRLYGGCMVVLNIL